MLSLHPQRLFSLTLQNALRFPRRQLLSGVAAFCATFTLFSFYVTPCSAAGWATFQVDDSLSQVQEPSAQLRWRTIIPNRATANILDAAVNVRIVLNTSPWIGKPARIYMLMPTQPQSSLNVQWTTSGLLLPGQLFGGQRRLVFQGVIPGPRVEDWMHVAITTDARDQVTAPRTNFTFEIEVLR